MLSLKQNHSNSVLEQTCCFILSYDVEWYFFYVFECSLSLLTWGGFLGILRQLSFAQIPNPRIILQIWLLSAPLIVLFPDCRTGRTPGLRGSKPQPSTTELRALQTQPQDLEISWNDNSGPARSRGQLPSCCPVSICANPPSPSTLLWRGAAREPSPSADAESRTSIVLTFTGPCKVNTASFREGWC